MRFLSSVFLVLIFTIWALPQSGMVVTGTLIDRGAVIANARISLITSDQTFDTITDERGNYSFENIPDGNYLLRFGNRNASIRIENGLASISSFGEVVVVSSNTSQSFSEVAKTVSVIDASEIRERNEISLADALRTVPGFRVQQLGGFGKTASIKTRGLRNQDTAVLIDGFRLRDPAAITGDASPFISDFSLANVGRVEVLRGSGSSIYGTNAIGGVIDFQTPEPKSGFNGGIIGEYGSLGLKRVVGNLGDGMKDGRFGFNLGVSRTVYSEGIDGDDDAHNTNFQGRIDLNPFPKTNISGRVFVSDAFVRLNGSPDTLGVLPSITQIIGAKEGINFSKDSNDPDSSQWSKFFSGQVSLTQILTPNFVFKAGYQGLKTSRDNENGGLGSGYQPFGGKETSSFNGQIHTLNAKFDWTPSSHNLITFGYEYEQERYGNEGFGPSASSTFFTRVNQSSNSFFIQDLIGLYENKLQLAGGFRAQWFKLSSPDFSVNNAPYSNLNLSSPPTSYTFDGAISYYFRSTGTKLRAHSGNGYRVPSLYERFGTFYSSFSQDFTALGDPNLEPERSIAFDGGIDQSISNDRIRLSATYFYTKLIDTIGYSNAAPAIGTTIRPFGGYFNTKGGIARGAELSGDIKISEITNLFASYTLTNSDQRESQVVGSGILTTLGIPDQQISIVATQSFGTRLSINFDFLATSSYLAPIFSNSIFSTRIYRFNGNRKADLAGRYEMPISNEKIKFSIFGTVENIFGSEYFENGFQTAGRTVRGGLGVRF